jgi:hypothetical protein
MKTILKLLSVIAMLLLISGCKEKDCVGNDCPLPDGSFCPNNMINVNDNCTCPDGFTEFNQNCLDPSIFTNTYVGNLNCECFKSGSFGLDVSGIGYSIETSEGFFGNSSSYQGTIDNFILTPFLSDLKCKGDTVFPEIKGRLVNDTLSISIYWNAPNNGIITIIDSCVGIKIPRL